MHTHPHTHTHTPTHIRTRTHTRTHTRMHTHAHTHTHTQKYDASRNEFVFRNKYYGRSLSEDGFREELRSFLHNGVRFRSELLSAIIGTLEELVDVIQRQDSYRFFSSSLLIIYEGAEESGCGLTSSHPHSQQNGLSQITDKTSTIINGQTANGHLLNAADHMMHKAPLAVLRKRVDVRMIDFAHGVHSSFGDTPFPVGCDDDYLHGLRTLVTQFKELLSKH